MAQKFKPITLTPGLYQLGTPFFPVYLSMGEEGLLIEGGISATADIIVDQLKELKISPERIKYVALTHTHADHIGALPRLKKRWPHLKSIASPLAAKILSNTGMIKPFQSLDNSISQILKSKSEISEIPRVLDQYDFTIDIVADENSRFNLGNGISWTTCPVPGHAPCQTAFFEEKEGTLAIGDAVGFYNPAEKVFWPNYFESLHEYIDSIKKLAQLPARRIALSHNGVIETDVKGFFTQALASTGKYHHEMLDRLAKGESSEDIAQEKATWVHPIADYMPFVVMPILCRELIRQSEKAAEKGGLNFEL